MLSRLSVYLFIFYESANCAYESDLLVCIERINLDLKNVYNKTCQSQMEGKLQTRK